MSLSLNWTYQRNRVSILVKFELNKNNFILKKCNDVVNSEDVKKKSKVLVYININIYIYIYIF